MREFVFAIREPTMFDIVSNSIVKIFVGSTLKLQYTKGRGLVSASTIIDQACIVTIEASHDAKINTNVLMPILTQIHNPCEKYHRFVKSHI